MRRTALAPYPRARGTHGVAFSLAALLGLVCCSGAALAQDADDEPQGEPAADEEDATIDAAKADEDAAAVDAAAEEQEPLVPTVRFGGALRSDVRFRVDEKAVGAFYDRLVAPLGVSRNENLVKIDLGASIGPVRAVVDLDLVFYGYAREVDGLAELSHLGELNPFRLDPHAAYLEIVDLFTEGLDVRVGQQTVRWGVAHHFNPTDNLSADDVEDPLEYGRQQGNLMLRLDYRVNRYLSHAGVVVPVFRPALLAATANLAWTRVDRLGIVDPALRHRLEAETATAAGPLVGTPHVVRSVVPELPETSFDNVQVGYRVALDVAEQHVALDYYLGRTDFPQARLRHVRHDPTPVCDPDTPTSCTRGVLADEITVDYPRMHVFGLNAEGTIPLQDLDEGASPLGYHFEGALVVPRASELAITSDDVPTLPRQGAGTYDYDGDGRPGGPAPATVEDTPFAKWVLGLSYQFVPEVWAEVQWVHGLPEEYGAGDFFSDGDQVLHGGIDGPYCAAAQCALTGNGSTSAYEVLRPRLGDYLTLQLDVRLLEDRLLLRAFGMFDLLGVSEDYYDVAAGERVRVHHSLFTPAGFSAVVTPEVEYEVVTGATLAAGAQLQLGRTRTKFGDPARGGSTVFTRAQYRF